MMGVEMLFDAIPVKLSQELSFVKCPKKKKSEIIFG